jgi:hypothetical protein
MNAKAKKLNRVQEGYMISVVLIGVCEWAIAVAFEIWQ